MRVDRIAVMAAAAMLVWIAPAVGHLIHDQAPDVWLAAVNDWPA